MMSDGRIPIYLFKMGTKYPKISSIFMNPGKEQDQLFQAVYDHLRMADVCDECDKCKLVNRSPRLTDHPAIHYVWPHCFR
jgi:hypothetical protein